MKKFVTNPTIIVTFIMGIIVSITFLMPLSSINDKIFVSSFAPLMIVGAFCADKMAKRYKEDLTQRFTGFFALGMIICLLSIPMYKIGTLLFL